LTGGAIVAALEKLGIATDESTLRTHFLPQLVPYGMKNRPRAGYFIPLEARPGSDSPKSIPSNE
jgi:hypothetical protein